MNKKENPFGNRIAYSLDEAAVLTSLSKTHLRAESRRGKLKLIKSGRRTIILKETLDEYLKELGEATYQPQKIKVTRSKNGNFWKRIRRIFNKGAGII